MVLLLILPACQSSGPDDPVWQKREANLKQMYTDKITALENEIEERKAKETTLAASIKKLEEELRQAKAALTQAEIAAVTPEPTAISTEQPSLNVHPPDGRAGRGVAVLKQTIAGKILAINKGRNILIISVGKTTGIQPGARYNISRSGEIVGMIEIGNLEKDWLTASPVEKDDITRYKISDEVLLTSE